MLAVSVLSFWLVQRYCVKHKSKMNTVRCDASCYAVQLSTFSTLISPIYMLLFFIFFFILMFTTNDAAILAREEKIQFI